MKEIKQINEEFVKEGASKITDRDIESVVDKSKEIEQKFQKGGPLGRFIEVAKLLNSLVKNYRKGKYKKIPWWVISTATFALLYVLNPLDIIPDVIPIIGQLDDIAVIAICLLLIEQQLHDYKEWKLQNFEK